MSKVECNSLTVLSTGDKIPVLSDSSLVIQRVVLWISTSNTESSAGYYDSSVTFTGSIKYKDENTTKAITHYRTVGGVKTLMFEATVTYLDTGEFGINVTTCAETTKLNYVVFGI